MSKLLQRLTDAKRSGVYRASRADEILDATRDGALDVVTIDLGAGVFDSMARALDFPDWFGRNWDALEDCLGDLSWRGDRGRVLILRNAPRGEARGTLLEVLGTSAQYWAREGRPFFAVLIDPGRELALPNLYREE